MSDIYTMRSIERVIEKHGDEIRKEWTREVPEALAWIFSQVLLFNDVDAIQVEWEFRGGATLPGPSMDIDILLAERFPDCEEGC